MARSPTSLSETVQYPGVLALLAETNGKHSSDRAERATTGYRSPARGKAWSAAADEVIRPVPRRPDGVDAAQPSR
jgi:hypothetical protein